MSYTNLERTFEHASDADRRIAMESYPRYHRLTGAIAARHGYPLRVGAAVFAALSPNSDYIGNLRDTDRLLAAAAAGQPLDSFKVSTYGQNKRKAWRIAQGEDPLALIVADKTRNFYLNILDPADPLPVTVDGHMVNIWRGERVNLAGLRFPDGLYEEIAEGVRRLAAAAGLLGNQAQGIVWHAHKRIHRIRMTMQQEFWAADCLAANLGWVPRFSSI